MSFKYGSGSAVFCFLLTVGAFTSVFKDNKLSNHKIVEIKAFLNFWLVGAMIRIQGSVQIITDPDTGGPKTP